MLKKTFCALLALLFLFFVSVESAPISYLIDRKVGNGKVFGVMTFPKIGQYDSLFNTPQNIEFDLNLTIGQENITITHTTATLSHTNAIDGVRASFDMLRHGRGGGFRIQSNLFEAEWNW